jgi:hypothetical protein
LAREVTLDQYQVRQQGLRGYFGGDNKISDDDLLRPVGSVNFKAVVLKGLDQPDPVEWIVKPSALQMEPEAPKPQSKPEKASAGTGTGGSGSAKEVFNLAFIRTSARLALQEYGRLVRTIYLCRYVADAELRRRVRRQLNKGEPARAAPRSVLRPPRTRP